jgi:hypothetical protein
METNEYIRLADVLQVIKSERQDASGNVALTPAERHMVQVTCNVIERTLKAIAEKEALQVRTIF